MLIVAGGTAAYASFSKTITVTVDGQKDTCLLYTSDAADDLLCVDLGGRRIIKKKMTISTITAFKSI